MRTNNRLFVGFVFSFVNYKPTVSPAMEKISGHRMAAEVDASGRMRGVTIVKPVVYGSQAFYFTKKREEDGHTHSWKVYLRPYYNEDTSKWIRKVTFKLHESYANSTRVCEKPPYEVKETGWGEFEVLIKVYFVDPNEKPVTCITILKLFQQDPMCIAGKKPVIAEYYDEIVFQEPSQYLYKHLMSTEKPQKSILKGNDPDMEDKKQRTLELITAAREEVRGEITDLKESLKEARSLLQQFRTDQKKAIDQSAPSTPASTVTDMPPPSVE